MRRSIFIFTLILLFNCAAKAQQMTTSQIRLTTTYSPNGKYYIKCVPYDNEEPSLRGKSSVYNKNGKLLYTLDRDFDNVRDAGNFLSISDDGETIVYVIVVNANENTDGLKTVSIYKKAKLVKSFTLPEITGCDGKTERCMLKYYNYDKVVDIKKSNPYMPGVKRIFKDGIPDEEKFLNDYAIFTNDKNLYITDTKKVTHIISLKNYSISNVNFDEVYPQLTKIAKIGERDFQLILTPTTYPKEESAFPNLLNGDTTGIELGKYIGMKALRINNVEFQKYRFYQIHLGAYISRDGKIELANIDADAPLPLDKIKTFFNSHLFDVSFLPTGIDKWYFSYFFWLFRNPSNEQAMQEKVALDKQRALEREKRLTLDSIEHVYIPKNLEDCYVQLDKLIATVVKSEMLSLKNSGSMGTYHFSLGMSIRNNWGLHGGSRLSEYFKNRGLTDAENISSIILNGYYDWLNNKKDGWKEFEAQHPIKSK